MYKIIFIYVIYVVCMCIYIFFHHSLSMNIYIICNLITQSILYIYTPLLIIPSQLFQRTMISLKALILENKIYSDLIFL